MDHPENISESLHPRHRTGKNHRRQSQSPTTKKSTVSVTHPKTSNSNSNSNGAANPSQQTPGQKPDEGQYPTLTKLGLADLVTMGNAACGAGSIFLCLNYLENAHYEKYIILAFFLLPLGYVFDCMDGYIARKRYSSPFGKDLDSLADLVSFGVAPACLGFTLGLRGIWDSFVMLVFVLCCMVRLARFNVTTKFISNSQGKVPYYEGLPSPANLLIVGLFFIAWSVDRIHENDIWGGKVYIYPGHFHPLSLIYLVFGCLMIAQFHIKKF